MSIRRGVSIDASSHAPTVLDPVCRMEIRQDQAVASATLDGWRHFDFCSLSCHEAFLDTPHAYVGWADRTDHRRTQPRPLALPPYLTWGDRPR